MIESSLILDGHPVRLRGNFAIHHPGEFTAKFKPFRLYHIDPFPRGTSFVAGFGGAGFGGCNVLHGMLRHK